MPSHGVLIGNGNGSDTYTPSAGYAGRDSFTYTISDGRDGSDTAVVTISVNQVIDIAAARTAILAGVSTMHSGVQPGRTVAYGPEAFAVARYPGDLSEGPMVAAAGCPASAGLRHPDSEHPPHASHTAHGQL